MFRCALNVTESVWQHVCCSRIIALSVYCRRLSATQRLSVWMVCILTRAVHGHFTTLLLIPPPPECRRAQSPVSSRKWHTDERPRDAEWLPDKHRNTQEHGESSDKLLRQREGEDRDSELLKRGVMISVALCAFDLGNDCWINALICVSFTVPHMTALQIPHN